MHLRQSPDTWKSAGPLSAARRWRGANKYNEGIAMAQSRIRVLVVDDSSS